MDEIFFVDFLGEVVCRDIFSIYLIKCGYDFLMLDLDFLVYSSEGFFGVEVEQVLVLVLYCCQVEGVALDIWYIMDEIVFIKLLLVVMVELLVVLCYWVGGWIVVVD